jgi:nucleoside-diphosphate-sugar epimerase
VRILVTGNMGYVGSVVVTELRAARPDDVLIGLDTGYFAHCLTGTPALPERYLDCQYFADVREPPAEALEGVDAVVHLAAISNDPIGDEFEDVTDDVNRRAAVELAEAAKTAGARAFVFASSCSMYGFAGGGVCSEDSPLDPLTAYARSKVAAERELAALGDERFLVSCLRFATACGMSDRLRLDLVLNDFVAAAVAERRILILSDGMPWRPLIHVRDMARAIDWALDRGIDAGGPSLTVNVGADGWNYRVRDLADAVAALLPHVEVEVASDAQPDHRSYRVGFELFSRLAPDHQPRVDLETAILGLHDGLVGMGFDDPGFRASPRFARLAMLNALRERGYVSDELVWGPAARARADDRRRSATQAVVR